ncbi:MAG TPA: hypothetical protein PLX97_05130 [Gemmatales bacterium]|nr:hypothetical protein [Gemmatales bacterium]
MTHTEESLMALAQAATVAAAKSPYLGENHYLVAQDALRLAIREVLAERDVLGIQRDNARAEVDRADYATQRAVERAERAEAEKQP